MKIHLPLILVLSVSACSSSSNSGPDTSTTSDNTTASGPDTTTIPDDPTTSDPDTTTIPDDPTTSDPDTITTPDDPTASDPDTSTTPRDPTTSETELETASRIDDLATYVELIDVINTLEADGEFTNENYLQALYAVAENSQSKLTFQRAKFLELLETNIQDGTSGFTFVPIAIDGFNRRHTCPDGGSLSAIKNVPAVPGNLSGNYTFRNCVIGDIFIDGRYNINETINTNRLDVSYGFSPLKIIGVDGIETSLSAGYTQRISISANANGGEVLTTISSDGISASIDTGGAGVLRMNRTLSHTETAEAETVEVDTLLDATSRTVRILRSSLSVLDDSPFILGASTDMDLVESSEESTFELGQITLTLSDSSNRLFLQAENGDPDSYIAIIVQADESSVSFNQRWNNEPEFGPLDFGSLDRLPAILAPR